MRQALQGQLASYVEIEVVIEARSKEIDGDPHIVLQRHVWVYQYRLAELGHTAQRLPPLSSAVLLPLQLLLLSTELLEHPAEDRLLLLPRPGLLDLPEDGSNLAELDLLAQVRLLLREYGSRWPLGECPGWSLVC